MSEPTFTPGPWFVVGPPWGDGSWITNGAGGDPHGGKPIAHEGDLFGDDDDKYVDGEKDATLRLIAAAPDLFTALRHLAEACEVLQVPGISTHEAREALKKAVGP